jgi:TatD DNase family protein
MTTDLRLPTLDAHVHIAHSHGAAALEGAGAALAMTLSLEEASQAVDRTDSIVLWGVGCHPTDVLGQENFQVAIFKKLVEHSAVVGEIGLDRRSEVPFERQVTVFRQILEVVADNPRIVSIHSNHATADVLEELEKKRISVPVLHWWNGSNSRTRSAVEIGCMFSVNARIAGYSRFSTLVPIERILVETDLGYEQAPSVIPGRVEQAEQLVAQEHDLETSALRRVIWRNFARVVEKTDTGRFVSARMAGLLKSADQ